MPSGLNKTNAAGQTHLCASRHQKHDAHKWRFRSIR